MNLILSTKCFTCICLCWGIYYYSFFSDILFMLITIEREEVTNKQKYSHYFNAVWHWLIISNSNGERLRFNMLSISLRKTIRILHFVWKIELTFCDADASINNLADQFISFICIIHKKRENKYKWRQRNMQIELSHE